MVAITKYGRKEIFDAVKQMYTTVARQPEQGFHFPTGRPACEFLDYPAEQLDSIPDTAVESFAGVGYPFRCNGINDGDTILDIGAGSGTDVLICALMTGENGKVYGLDMTDAMQEKLEKNVEKLGVNNVELLQGNAEEIPLADESVDVVTSNGVLNLVPDKPRAFSEIYRVLKPGGRFQIADIVINKGSEELDSSKNNPRLWAECIVGALHEDTYIQALIDAGFKDVKLHCEQDYFSRSSNESTRKIAEYFSAKSITLSGVK
jgi:ubiquinone/menaquinone biosynthesis C-methylase UbiE